MCPPSQEAWELTDPICGRTHSTTSTRTKEPWEELVIYCPATKQSKVTVQHRSGLTGLMVEEMDDTPQPPSPLLGLQQRSRGHSEQPGPRDRDKVYRYPGGQTHRAGQVVSKMRPPGGSGGGQPTKVQSKMTLRPRAPAPVNRSRSLVQVQPPSQFSGRTEEQGQGGPLGDGRCRTTANRHRDDPSPSQRDVRLCVGDPTWGGGTTRGVEVARQGQLDTKVRDTVNSDSAATLEGPPGLGFLGTGAQGARDTPEDLSVGLDLGEPGMQYPPELGAGLSETSVEESFGTWGNM